MVQLQPQTIEGISKVEWVPLAELREKIPETYPLIMDLVRKVLTLNPPKHA